MGSSAFLLPLEPRGLYREMLTQAWRRGAKLPADHASVRRACGVTREEWDRCWPSVAPYWVERDGWLVNETQQEVYQEAEGVRMRATIRAKRGASARWPDAQAHAQALPEHCPPSPSPTDQSKEQTDHDRVAERFERWWSEYPRKVGKDAAWREWLKRSPADDLTDQMIAVVRRQRASAQWRENNGKFIPHPRTWLHQGRWQDEPEGFTAPEREPEAEHWKDECIRLKHHPECPHESAHWAVMQRKQPA